jgi:hypothetical protein
MSEVVPSRRLFALKNCINKTISFNYRDIPIKNVKVKKVNNRFLTGLKKGDNKKMVDCIYFVSGIRDIEIKEQKNKLSYLEMICEALKTLNPKNRFYVSRIQIKNYIKINYTTPAEHIFERSVRRALSKGICDGVIIQNKQSFRLASKH